MSNFAERLVARSAGTPPGPGISVLAPRPVSRFEPVGGMEVEETVSSDVVLPRADPPFAQRETERTPPKPAAAKSRRRETPTSIVQSRPRDAEPDPRAPIAPPIPVPNAMEATPDHVIQNVSLPDIPEVMDDVPQQVTQPASRDDDNPAPEHVFTDDMTPLFEDETAEIEPAPPRIIGSNFEIESARLGRPARGAGHASASGDEQPGQLPAPAISIGRIEVQFLPQEPRMPAPRPQPQRTRGFDAYARARRGEPR